MQPNLRVRQTDRQTYGDQCFITPSFVRGHNKGIHCIVYLNTIAAAAAAAAG